jgi:hypothetical protein
VATTKTVLRLSNLEINEVNRVLQAVADRLDKQEGWRGTPEFQADINLNDNKATNVAEAVEDDDAVNLGQASSAVTDATGAVTGTIFAGIGFSQLFVSSPQIITATGALTLAHGLSSKPVLYLSYLVCVTAELGYSIGDEILHGVVQSTLLTNGGCSISPDTTDLNIRFGLANPTFVVINKTTGAAAIITQANWNIIFRAWA